MQKDKYRLNVELSKEEKLGFELVCPSHGERSRVIRNFINKYIEDNIGARTIEVSDAADKLEENFSKRRRR